MIPVPLPQYLTYCKGNTQIGAAYAQIRDSRAPQRQSMGLAVDNRSATKVHATANRN